jgi:hypothetical protein
VERLANAQARENTSAPPTRQWCERSTQVSPMDEASRGPVGTHPPRLWPLPPPTQPSFGGPLPRMPRQPQPSHCQATPGSASALGHLVGPNAAVGCSVVRSFARRELRPVGPWHARPV